MRSKRTPEENQAYDLKYSRSKRGIIARMYSAQKSNTIKRNKRRGEDTPPPSYTLKEFREWCLTQDEFHSGFNAWEASGYQKYYRGMPSVDRLDDAKGYSFDNIQMRDWGFNFDKGHRHQAEGLLNDKQVPVAQMNLDGRVLHTYISQSIAARATGVRVNNINMCCRGSRKTAGGFMWQDLEVA